MKSHFSEELDDAYGHLDTAADAVVVDHRIPKSVWTGEALVAAILVGSLLALAVIADRRSAPAGHENGASVRAHTPPNAAARPAWHRGVADRRHFDPDLDDRREREQRSFAD